MSTLDDVIKGRLFILLFILIWLFSRELPTRGRAGVLTLKGSHTLGDGKIQLKVLGPLSLKVHGHQIFDFWFFS